MVLLEGRRGRKGAALSLSFLIGMRFFSAVVKTTPILANSNVLFLLVNCGVHYRFNQNNPCLLYLLSCLDHSLGVIAISTLTVLVPGSQLLRGRLRCKGKGENAICFLMQGREVVSRLQFLSVL